MQLAYMYLARLFVIFRLVPRIHPFFFVSNYVLIPIDRKFVDLV